MDYIRELEKMGLKENEAKVYLAGLSLGPTKISEIEKLTKLKRTNIYAIINKLMELGLFKLNIIGLKRLFEAESPEKLEPLAINKVKNNINKLRSAFVDYAKSNPSQIVYYKGISGIRTASDLMLENLKRGDFYRIFGDAVSSKIDEKFFTNFFKKRSKLGLELKGIFAGTTEAKQYQAISKSFNHQVKLLSSKKEFGFNLAINPHKIMFYELAKPYSVIVINNQKIAQVLEIMFSMIWDNI